MKKIFLILSITIFILTGCTKEENIKISDLQGYWVDEHIYTNELGVDKVIHFSDDDKMIVYSYYDKGTTIYNANNEKSSSNKIVISLDNNQTIKLDKVEENKYKYTVDNEELYIVKIDENEANEFIKVIENNSEF